MKKEQHIHDISEETLATFSEISDKAKEGLKNLSSIGAGALASVNTMTSANTVNNLNSINRQNSDAYERLQSEPAIARIVIEGEGGEVQVLFISRSTPVALDGSNQHASYNSPLGRLASLPVGDVETITLAGSSQEYTLVESSFLRPRLDHDGWDAPDTVFRHEQLGTQTIRSMRALLGSSSQEIEDELAKILAGEPSSENIQEGVIHQIRKAMGLRDQPILDKFQDGIFRLPINSQLIILGPPGTGKTTTLIKRLGQKIDLMNLDDIEKTKAKTDLAGIVHSKSWLMFTPTDLLKHYVKEAFNREGVPTPEDRIQTWESTQHNLARNVLGLIQSGVSKGKFNQKKGLVLLNDDVLVDPRKWFDEFSAFHQNRLVTQLQDGVDSLNEIQSSSYTSILSEVTRAIQKKSQGVIAVYSALLPLEAQIKPILEEAKETTDKLIHKCLLEQFDKDKKFLQLLADQLNSINLEEDTDDDELFDDDGEEVNETSLHTPQTAAKEYNKVIKSLARHKVLKRSVSKNSSAWQIKNWLGERLPDNKVLIEIGSQVASQNGIRRFINAHRRFVTEVSTSYKKFRKLSALEGKFYQKIPDSPRHITNAELDAIVLLTLKTSRELMSTSAIRNKIDEPGFSYLKKIASNFRNQILVDEATDFSIIQLACMHSLTSLQTLSYFACGDFNQRITSYGIRSKDQLNWVDSRIKSDHITTVYRQSEKLNELAKGLLSATGGDSSSLGQLPDDYQHPGVSPVLLENCKNINQCAEWLSVRIREIERTVELLPTIGVLVNCEEDVELMAIALNVYLEEYSHAAEACKDGKSLGNSKGVRVFSIDHIKGLEFEVVFFVGVDDLAESKPDLFDKYLYVGVTRAATYLGLTCTTTLPDRLSSLQGMFGDSWEEDAR